jgi:hypothetical protein
MTNAELIERFESSAACSDSFHHADHVRLAFAYLSENPPLQALEKFTAALKRSAAARGKPGLYHDSTDSTGYFRFRPYNVSVFKRVDETEDMPSYSKNPTPFGWDRV